MKIKEKIISEIKKKEKIDVSQFVQLCLYGDDGYYIKNNAIGKKNDFITSPEISQMFGEILAIFLINYWNKNIKKEFNLIELGPGTGALIVDILRTANVNKDFLNALNLILIEKNETLIIKQKIKLTNENFYKVDWIQDLDIKTKNIPAIIFSNEFFDCFPVRQFYRKNKWYEKYIKYNETQKIFNFIPEEVNNLKLLNKLEKFNDVGVAEISDSRKKYFELVCKYIKKNSGICITIDYGYKDPIKNLSLQTIYNHKKTHLFENLGNQDITAHVNFDELINIAYKCKLKIELFSNQRDFLIGYGLKKRKEELQKNQNEKIFNKLELEYERLTDQSQMGTIFKVLVISCL